MKTYHVSFQGDPKIIFNAMRLGGKYLYSTPQIILMQLGSVFLTITSVLGGAALFTTIRIALGLEPLPENILYFSMVGLISGAVILWLQIWPHSVAAKRSAKSALGHDVKITFSPMGLRLTGGQSDWFTAWQDIDAVAKGKVVLGFLIGAIVIHVPLSAFENDDTRMAALDDIQRWHTAARDA